MAHTMLSSFYRYLIIAAGWQFVTVPLAMANSYADDCLPAYLQPYKVLGKATDLKGKPLYEETLTFTPAKGGQLQVAYVTPKAPLANKTVQFQCRIASPNFVLLSPIGEILISVRREQGKLLSFGGQNTKPHVFPSQEFIVDAGFDNYVKQHWQELVAGKVIKVDFFFPNRQTFLRLKIQKSAAPKALKQQVGDNPEDVVFFKISANNFIFRMFSSPLYIGYRPDRSLRYYLGISNLPMIDESPVLISYQPVN